MDLNSDDEGYMILARLHIIAIMGSPKLLGSKRVDSPFSCAFLSKKAYMAYTIKRNKQSPTF